MSGHMPNRAYRPFGIRWLLRIMGQSETTGEIVVPSTPPEIQGSRRRKDYLHRLGIQENKNIPKQKARDHVVEQDSIDEHNPNDKLENTNKEWELNVFDIKNQNDFRVDFLRKLSYNKVWVPKALQAPTHQTVIIFDWDDTLLCTSFLQWHRDEHSCEVYRQYVQGIETTVRSLLESAMRLGQTFIITNASHGWVEHSAKKWAPDLLPVLEKVRIISARARYEPYFPREMNKWKIAAFLEVQRQLDSQIITNLVSLGDSKFEMDAVQVMGKQFAQALIKTIKFLESPSPEQLLNQLQRVNQKFEQVVGNACDWIGGAQ